MFGKFLYDAHVILEFIITLKSGLNNIYKKKKK